MKRLKDFFGKLLSEGGKDLDAEQFIVCYNNEDENSSTICVHANKMHGGNMIAGAMKGIMQGIEDKNMKEAVVFATMEVMLDELAKQTGDSKAELAKMFSATLSINEKINNNTGLKEFLKELLKG